MRKRDSGGPSRGKRGASRQNNAGKGRSSGKPAAGKSRYTSSAPRRSEDAPEGSRKKFSKGGPSSAYRKEDKRSFTRSEPGVRKQSSFDKDARPKRPYPKQEEGNERKKRFGDSREESGERRKPAYGKGAPRTERPFSRASEGGDRKKKFSKPGDAGFDAKPKRKREEGDASERGFFKKQSYSKGAPKRYTPKKQEAPTIANTTGKIRLNRYIANSGVCSRREADELIKMGLVSVNGKIITEMGFQVNPGDEVRYEDKLLRAEKPVYLLLNKPKGFLTTTKDPQERNTVMHIVANAVKERIYPVGRLDRNTTGLLLLTNDGELADKLSHPSYNVKKIYKVELDRPLTKSDFQKILDGIRLEEGRATVDDLAIVSEDGKTVGIELHIGWNRIVRRIFESLEYQVVKLDRSVYAGLDKKDLPRGHYRFLTPEEVVRLKHYK
jgi:23S rRNA pseudouridine2605 synthase